MEIDYDKEIISSLPLVVQREFEENNEPIDLIDPVEPVDAPTYMTMSRKMPRRAQQTLPDVEGHEAPHGTY